MEDAYMDGVISGDAEAFRYFLKTYKDMAFNVAIAIVKDDQHAEEIVQDAFMKAFNGLKSFNRTAKFKSWFYRIVVNESYLKLRKTKRNLPLLDINEVVTINNIELIESNSSEIDKIKLALKLLPANESLALNLFYLEEYKIKEIGNITGWTSSNTKVILHRARKNIRIILESVKNQNHG